MEKQLSFACQITMTSTRCRVLYTVMTYLTLTTYCWMLCEGIHIFICLEHPLQVKTMIVCMYDMYQGRY